MLTGITRSRITSHYALITPDTWVWSSLPGWTASRCAVHISPTRGARFSQITVEMEVGGLSAIQVCSDFFMFIAEPFGIALLPGKGSG